MRKIIVHCHVKRHVSAASGTNHSKTRCADPPSKASPCSKGLFDESDPYWYEKAYINGYYGDLFAKQGGSRSDLAGFGRFLCQFGMDMH